MAAVDKLATVLTIDDERPLRRSIREYLEDYNYEVIEAEDGETGQEILLAKNLDLVLVDLRMPKVNGLEVLQFVKEKRPEMPIIVISGTGHIPNVVEALRLGAWDYILKPIQDMTVLLHSVEKALERARMIRERRLYRERLEEEVARKTKALNLSNEFLNREIEVRKKGEDEIRRTMDYLSNVINSIPVMLTTIDRNDIITQWNKAAENYTGIPLNQAVSKNLWQLVPFLEKYRSDSDKVRQSGKPENRQGEIQIDGGKKHYRISMSPLARKPGTGVVIQVEDTTELKRKDEQLRQAQKMETVGILAGGLAHDFNNVLGGIIGPLSIIQGEMEGNDISPDTLKKYLSDIDKSAKRAADIVKHLLALSRKEERTLDVVDLNRVIRHVMRICQNTFDKNVELNPVYTKKTARVFADPAQMEQVLLNLCVNSYHAMTIMRGKGENRGGKLTVSLKKFQVDEMFCEAHPEAKVENYWKLTVEDNGVGMQETMVSRIFSPFYTTKKGKGTGLGLTMVYNIIKMHKGFVTVYSKTGQGTAFKVYLPELKAEIFEDKKQPLSRKQLKGKGLILVVEDEPIMRKVAINILKNSGFDVLVARDGAEAIPLFKKHHRKIRLVLLDMWMPKKSGREAYLDMRKINPELKVLLNSGFGRDERVDEIMKLGISDFIEKPYTKIQLLRAVHDILDR